MENLEPKIYVACLAAYNNGKLHGKWINATQDIDSIWQEIKDMLASSPEPDAEEWSIHDFEDFGGINISENESLDNVVAIAQFIAEQGGLGAKVLIYRGGEVEDALQLMEDWYQGEYDSEEDFTQSLYEECYDIPEHLAIYIDYQKIARDLFICDYFSIEVGSRLHVFTNA